MATVGQVIENPSMGARIEFRQVAGTTSGELLEFDFYLRRDGVIAVDHLHPRQEESFHVITGAVRGQVAGVAKTLASGASSAIGAGVIHGWRNDADGETQLRVSFRPALRSAEFFETVFALARAGKTDSAGVPRFPYNLAVVAAFSQEFRPADMPRLFHAATAVLLRPLGRRLLKNYSSSTSPPSDRVLAPQESQDNDVVGG